MIEPKPPQPTLTANRDQEPKTERRPYKKPCIVHLSARPHTGAGSDGAFTDGVTPSSLTTQS